METGKFEKVGAVTLDLSDYCGSDLYCDGAVEDELLEIVATNPATEYNRIIEERCDWPTLYHLSPIRENIVSKLPISKSDKVLEVGSGCGAITGALTRLAGTVVSCDLSKKRSLINANRHKDDANLTIHVGNFCDVERNLDCDFDWICLIGVFEYAQCYIDSKTPYDDFLEMIRRHLSPKGRIVIAIENRLGLKYFAGCREDHLGTMFTSLTGYSDSDRVQTFSKDGLTTILSKCDERLQFFYPYPDYKLMHTLYSDKHLPKVGELKDNMRNYDRDRYLLFDEKRAFDTMAKDGTFPIFSNSFLVIMGEPIDLEYARFSNDRSDETAIVTSFEGDGYVTKRAMFAAGEDHIRQMSKAYEELSRRYAGSKISVNECNMVSQDGKAVAKFPIVAGKTLEELMDERLLSKDTDGFIRLFDEYVERIGANEEYPFTDKDVVFSNILVNGDEWTLIDYEWTEAAPVLTAKNAFRALHLYLIENKQRNIINLDELCAHIGITAEEADKVRSDEAAFQKKVTNGAVSLTDLRDRIGCRVIDPLGSTNDNAYRFQVYRDYGTGFSEENSEFMDRVYGASNSCHAVITFTDSEPSLRIDPLMDSCIITIESILINGNDCTPKYLRKVCVNGARFGRGMFVCDTKDPNMVFTLKDYNKKGTNTFDISLKIERLSEDLCRTLRGSLKRKL